MKALSNWTNFFFQVYNYNNKQHNYQCSSTESETYHWRDDALKVVQHPNRTHWSFGKRSVPDYFRNLHYTFYIFHNSTDGSTPRPYGGDPNTLGIKFRSLPENPKHHLQNRRHLADVQALPAPWTLPELSGWECEVNAPLDPTSYLLQGTEIIAVLDQVASRVPWCCW